MKRIYLDNAATTPVDEAVIAEMLPVLRDNYGNPSSIYKEGRDAKKMVEENRAKVAQALGAAPQEIFFTACGTEGDNWALRGVTSKNKKRGKHIITTAIEHHAILHTAQQLEKEGFDVTFLPVDKYGKVNPEDLKNALRDDTILVSIMMANNEIGTIEPIKEMVKIVKEHNPRTIFHTDAVQAFGNIPVDVKDLGVDLLSVSGHKIYGPKGIGALYIKKGTPIDNFMQGGAQERKRRPGTENTASIAGFGKAAEIAEKQLPEHMEHLSKLRDRLIQGVLESIPGSELTGHPTDRLPGNASFIFDYIEGEGILLSLDLAGIAGSSGSACTSGSLDPSHVLLAIGLPAGRAHGSLRLTIGRDTTEEDIDYVIRELGPIIKRLRAMSPLDAQHPIDATVYEHGEHHHH
ncbi:MAG: cysteine desulfurase NifS [Eubacteriaceae bacterium]|jgi:cysteine desulfurase